VIQVSKIKVTIAIPSTELPLDILPPEGAPGSAKAVVTLQVQCNDIQMQASLKAKSYRDVITKAQAAPHGAWAVLQGNLGPDGQILEAGLSVQPIVPKEPKNLALFRLL
jgi:hypothetical protein